MRNLSKIEALLVEVDQRLQQKNYAEAERISARLFAQEPQNAQAGLFLGMALEGLGHRERAISVLASVVRNSPDFLEGNQQMITLLRQCGRGKDAVGVCQAFLRRNPDHALMHSVLGACLADQQLFEESVHCFRRAVSLEPGNPRHQEHLARALRMVGNKAEALQVIRTALEIEPDRAGLHLNHGGVLAELGRFEEAKRSFEKALRQQPWLAGAIIGIVTSGRVSEDDSYLIENIKALLNDPETSDGDRCLLHYANAKAMDDLGRYKAVLTHLDLAVEIATRHPDPRFPAFDAKARAATSDLTLKIFSREYFSHRQGLGNPSELPVFIVGAPRSGTTLLDQILTSHPKIAGAGELLFWIEHAGEALGWIQNGDPRLKSLTERYLATLRNHDSQAPRVTDKMPMNYAALGIIHTLLPNARIIHLRRHPIDTCISLYLNGHGIHPKPFGETREQLVSGYRDYLKVVSHWRKTLPTDRFIEVRYEDLVADREGELRRLLPFLGMEWADQCLRHESNPTQISTPSRWQARQPIYTGSVERWRRYEPWLGVFAQLADVDTEN